MMSFLIYIILVMGIFNIFLLIEKKLADRAIECFAYEILILREVIKKNHEKSMVFQCEAAEKSYREGCKDVLIHLKKLINFAVIKIWILNSMPMRLN